MIRRMSSLQARLFLAFACVTVIAATLPMIFAHRTLYQDRLDLAGQQALSQAGFIRDLIDAAPDAGADAAYLDALFRASSDLPYRVTLADPTGRVVGDTHLTDDLTRLDNHSDRPEIETAAETGQGTSVRFSNSLGIESMYAAVRTAHGGTVRVAVPLANIEAMLRQEAFFLGVLIACVTAFCLLLSALITRRLRSDIRAMTEVVRCIAPDKPGRRLRDVPGREFLPLAAAVNRMADNIERAMSDLADQRSQLETILDSMHEGVLVLDRDGAIRRWNAALQDMFPDVSRAEGKQIIEGLPVPLLQRRAESLLRGDGAPEEAEAVQFEYSSGRYLVAHFSRPVEPGPSLGAVIVFYDATDIMRLERVRQDFVSNVSHELRTPLTAISGCAELLRDCPALDEEYKNFADIIQRHATMLTRVIGDLLDLARIENADEHIVMERVHLGAAPHEASDICGDQIRAANVNLDVAMPEEAYVSASLPLLIQVFRNLLENACRYAPAGSSIGVDGVIADGNITVTVSDRGPGIPGEALDRVFERFFQVEQDRSTASAGIGLAVCRHIIDRHGGRIWAESPWGEAATAVRFSLPLA